MFNRSFYDPTNWYWSVANAGPQLWSSASLSYVEPANAAYSAWLNTGGITTKIASVEDLLQVQQDQVLPRIIARGITINSTSNPAINAIYALDDASLSRITSLALGIAAGRPLPSGGSTFAYSDINGQPHQFTGPQFLDLAAACEGYVYNYGQALAATLSGSLVPYPSNTAVIR